MTTCPATISGQHLVDWMEVPAHIHDGDLETTVTPGYQRGICYACGEQFVKE